MNRLIVIALAVLALVAVGCGGAEECTDASYYYREQGVDEWTETSELYFWRYEFIYTEGTKTDANWEQEGCDFYLEIERLATEG